MLLPSQASLTMWSYNRRKVVQQLRRSRRHRLKVDRQKTGSSETPNSTDLGLTAARSSSTGNHAMVDGAVPFCTPHSPDHHSVRCKELGDDHHDRPLPYLADTTTH